MKKLLYLLFLFFPLCLRAQYGAEVVTFPWNSQYVFLGSLPISDAGNLHKLKVDILGGAWESSSTGETTFFIANRDALSIKQVTTGSGSAGRYTLHAYNNSGGGIDFYLLTNNFAAIAVKSVMLGGGATQLISNTLSSSPPAGLSEIQNLNITPVLVTGNEGNLGINTFSPDPAYKLSVNGSVRAKEVRVEAGWSDYVFYKGYWLRPLDEVGSYIRKNRHLPDVPSAAEVEKEGVNVGQTSAVLLRKIEELTLYLLEKDRQYTALQKTVAKNRAAQQKQIAALRKQLAGLKKQD